MKQMPPERLSAPLSGEPESVSEVVVDCSNVFTEGAFWDTDSISCCIREHSYADKPSRWRVPVGAKGIALDCTRMEVIVS